MFILDMTEHENECLDMHIFKKKNNACLMNAMLLDIKKECQWKEYKTVFGNDKLTWFLNAKKCVLKQKSKQWYSKLSTIRYYLNHILMLYFQSVYHFTNDVDSM